MKQLSGKYTEVEFTTSRGEQGEQHCHHRHSVALNNQEWDETMRKLPAMFGGVQSDHQQLACYRHG